MGMEGGKGWFDKGWVMVVEKGRCSKDGLLVVVVVVVWWRGGDNNNARARAGTSRKTPFPFLSLCFCVFGWGFVLFVLFDCFVLFCFVLLGWFMYSFYILFVNCTQFNSEIFQKTDPARV